MTLPNFVIIGAAKSGTTSLYKYLETHPQVFLSSRKEINFFCLEDEKPENISKLFSLIKNPIVDIETYKSFFIDADPLKHKAIGEVSPGYLFSPEISSSNIKKYCPDIKIIAILRNPISRAYSHFIYSQQIGRENNYNQNIIIDCKLPSNYVYFGHNQYFHRYLNHGFYYRNLSPYLKKFKSDQIKIYLFEELCDSPLKLMQDLLSFLEVDPYFDLNSVNIKNNQSGIPRNKKIYQFFNKKNSGEKNLFFNFIPKQIKKSTVQYVKNQMDKFLIKKAPPISDDLKSSLIEVYREDILSLQQLLQKDISHW